MLAIVTLGAGIAATVTAFAVADAVLLRPLQFPDADRLVMVWERPPSGEPRNLVNTFNFARWRAGNQTFDSLGVIAQLSMNVSGLGEAEQVDGLAVSSGFFDALGVKPLLGRTFTANDDRTRPPRTVVLSYEFWQQRYRGATDAIGRALIVNGTPREVVGIMPAGFGFPAARAASLYTSLPVDPAAPPGGRNLIVVGRLKTGIAIERARADLSRIADQLAIDAPTVDAGWGVSVFPLFEETVGSVRRVIWVVFGSVACLLVLACANVTNLLLIRASRRSSELAVRTALGASRGRLAEQLAAESILLTLAAAALGLAIATMLVPLVPTLFPQTFALPRASEIAISGTVVAVTIGIALVVGCAFSLLPVAKVAQHGWAGVLKTGGRSSSGVHARTRRALVLVEMAVALVLVFAAVLMGRSLAELYRLDLGFRTDRVLSMRMTLIPRKYPKREQIPQFVDRLLTEVRSVPDVAAAATIHSLPLSGIGSSSPVYRADRPAPPREQAPSGPVSVVSPNYFATMGIPLRGRDFVPADRIDGPGAVIISEALARRDFPGENPIGKHLTILFGLKSDFEIVGIAGDVRTTTLEQAPEPAVYISVTQEPVLDLALVMRMHGEPAAAAGALRAAVSRADPEQGVAKVQTLQQVIADAAARPRVQARVFGTFGALALAIAALGLYGVMAYGVELRRRDMGIALALGATPRAMLRSVLREAVVLAAVGGGIGAVIAWTASWTLQGLVYGVPANDPLVLLSVAAVLIGVACLASLGPALRATRVDPVRALRND